VDKKKKRLCFTPCGCKNRTPLFFYGMVWLGGMAFLIWTRAPFYYWTSVLVMDCSLQIPCSIIRWFISVPGTRPPKAKGRWWTLYLYCQTCSQSWTLGLGEGQNCQLITIWWCVGSVGREHCRTHLVVSGWGLWLWALLSHLWEFLPPIRGIESEWIMFSSCGLKAVGAVTTGSAGGRL